MCDVVEHTILHCGRQVSGTVAGLMKGHPSSGSDETSDYRKKRLRGVVTQYHWSLLKLQYISHACIMDWRIYH